MIGRLIIYTIILLFLYFLYSRYRYRYPKINVLKKYDYIDKNIALFNPSIVKYRGKYFGAMRKSKPNFIRSELSTEILFSEFDEKFNIKDWNKKINIPVPQELTGQYKYYQFEDARFYVLEDRLFSLQTFLGCNGINNISDCNRTIKICIIEWDENMNIIGSRIYSEIKGSNKNWCLMNYKNKNYMITDFYPFRYYEIDLDNNYNLFNKKEINHKYNGYLGAKVYSVENNKIKCIAHKRYFHKMYYIFKFFEIDMDNKNVSSISEDFSFSHFDGLCLQYPHFINKIDGKTIMSVGIQDRTSYLLELKEIY